MEEPLILERYRPLADLGSGGHGSVVLAFDTKMARRVAIKRLPLVTANSVRPVTRTGLAEARTAALLNHPHIVTVHEWDTDGAEAYIVMEDIDGASLASILDQRREPFDDDEAAAILEAVGGAVAFAHDNGVLHLDIKPDNVLVTRNGRVKVADFGIAVLTDATRRVAGTAGTIGYMPPEQIRGERLDERTDVWALAALMYEVLTDANPFDSDSAEGSLFKIEVAEIPAPSEFEGSLSPDVDDVLLTALSADPDDRFGSVDAFTAALRPFLGDASAGARSLAVFLDDTLGDELPYEGEYGPIGLWNALAPYSGWFRRAGAAALCGWLAWTGIGRLVAAPGAGLAAAGLVGLAAAVAPGLGLALGIVAFVLALGVVAGWPIGALAFALATAIWLVRGRRGESDALLPVAAPLFGALRCAPAVPLLAGFVQTPARAALASAVAALSTMSVSAATGAPAPFLGPGWRWLADPWSAGLPVTEFVGRITTPGVAITMTAWAIAGAICSAACGRGTRPMAIAGVAGGVACMAGGYALWGLLPGEPAVLAGAVIDLAIGAGLMLIVTLLGPPTVPLSTDR